VMMLTQSDMAKIEMNFPSASTNVASHTHQLTPWRSPYAVGFQRARLGNAKSWMWTASMPSTPTPRRTSSDMIRAGPCAALFSALEPRASRGAFVSGDPLLTRQSLPRDAQAMRLQHLLHVLPASVATDPLPTTGRVQDDVEGSFGSELAAQVVVEAALVVR